MEQWPWGLLVLTGGTGFKSLSPPASPEARELM